MIDIQPASLAQVQRGRGGHLVAIDKDVCDIAGRIKEIHPDLFLRWNEQGEYFVVLQDMGPNHRPHVVTTVLELDERLISRLRWVTSPLYNAGQEADLIDKEADARKDAEFSQKTGELSEQLAWAIREDIRKARPGPVYIPPDVSLTTGRLRRVK